VRHTDSERDTFRRAASTFSPRTFDADSGATQGFEDTLDAGFGGCVGGDDHDVAIGVLDRADGYASAGECTLDALSRASQPNSRSARSVHIQISQRMSP
jgi:hypothetical protein